MKNRNFNLIMNQPWAMKKDILEQAVNIIAKAEIKDLQAAAAAEFGSVNSGGISIANKIACIDIIGPISRYENCLSMLNGYATVDSVMAALDLASESMDVDGILLNINSPGGTVDGISELGEKISAVSKKKKVVAYVGGQACSAAYWLATAADKIVVNQTGYVGSIGCLMAIMDDSKAMENEGIKEIMIVSSQSPKKVPDINSEDGKSQIQAHVDALAEIFISTVAKNRGVSVEAVVENFGQGDVVLGAEAVNRGMADKVGTLETAFSMLTRSSENKKFMGGSRMLTIEQVTAEAPEVATALREQGAVAERERIQAIEGLDKNGAYASVISAMKYDGKSNAGDAAIAIVAFEDARRAGIKTQRDEDAGEIPAVESGDDADSRDDITKEAEAIAKASKVR